LDTEVKFGFAKHFKMDVDGFHFCSGFQTGSPHNIFPACFQHFKANLRTNMFVRNCVAVECTLVLKTALQHICSKVLCPQ
jgi:hypothetical protein